MLASFQSALHETEELGNEITSGLNRVLDKSGAGNGFVGKAAEALREKIDGHLKQFIDAIGQSFGHAAEATSVYRAAVEEAQAKSEQALNAAQGLPKDDAQLAGHKNQAHTAKDEYDAAVRTYRNKLSEAEHMIRQPISGWQLFLQAIGILEIILAIVGAIFGGWIGLLAFGIGMVVFIGTLVEFAEGKASILDVVLAFVGILFPSTKGINVGALAKGAFNALKNLPKSLSAGVTELGGTLGHLLTSGVTIKSVYNGVTALPGLVLRGLSGMADLAMKGVRITAAGLKLLGNTFRSDFQIATAGISTTLGKVAVYPISFGGRFLLGAVLPVDFFELGVGFKSAFSMGFGTRLLTPTAHLSQSALGGGLHVGALTAGHGGLTGLPTGASFDGLGHGALQGFDPGGFQGINTGFGSQAGGLHGLNAGTGIGGANGSLTSLHALNGGTDTASVGNLMANAGGLDAVGHLAAFDHSTGFQRTSAGLLEPLPTDLGGINLGGAHGFSDLGSGLHSLRSDLTPSGTGLGASFGDAMSSVRVATGHVEDFHTLGIPELRSIVDGDISNIRMTQDGISLQIGAEEGTPTTLHMNYSGSGLTTGEGKQVVVAPEVHEAIGTADLVAAGGAAHGLQTPPPAAMAGHVTTTDAKAGSAGTTTAVTSDVKTAAVDVQGGATADIKAGAAASAPGVDIKAGAAVSSPGVEVKTGSATGSSVTADVKAGSVGATSVTADVKTGSAGVTSPGAVKSGQSAAGAGGGKKAVRDLDALSGGAGGPNSPERLAEEPSTASVTAHGDHLGVSAREDLDLLGQREGAGDTAGASATTTHLKSGPDVRPTGAERTLDDGSGAVVVGGHVALRPTSTPPPKPRPNAGGNPGPMSRFEAVTGGVTGKTGKERLAAWDAYELSSAQLAGAERELDLTGGKLGRPSETVDQAAAKLDVQQAELSLDLAKGKMSQLGMDSGTIEGHLDALGIPGPRPSRMSDTSAGHAPPTRELGDETAKFSATAGRGTVPAAAGKSLPFSPGEIERFWKLDGERVDALFGGPHDPLSGDRRDLWREFTQARYDVGRIEGQMRGDQPHAGGSSGPSAHEVKLKQDLSTATSHLDDLKHQLDDVGIDHTDMDRKLWDLHSQSLKERPRLDGGGVQPGEPAKLDGLMAAHQKAEKAIPSAKSKAAQAQQSYDANVKKAETATQKFAELKDGTNKGATAKAKKELEKAETGLKKSESALDGAQADLTKALDALGKATDDLAAGVNAHVSANDLAQRHVHRYVEKLAAEGHVNLADVLKAHSGDLHRAMQTELDAGRPVRWEQMSLSGEKVKQQAESVLSDAQHLESLLIGPETKSGPTTSVEVKVTQELKDAALGLKESADRLGSMLEKGFVKDAATVGGLYALRAEHGALSFTAGKLAQRVDRAVKDASPGDVVHVEDVFTTEKAMAEFNELAQVIRKFRTDKAYADVPTGTQWKAVLPGKEGDWQKLFGSLDKLTPEQQTNFVRDLSQRNLEKLESDVEDLLKQNPGREQELRGLLENLKGLKYRIKHATPAYHAIANSGLMSSQGDLARRDVKFLASGKSSAKNTSNLGNDDFVFFRMDVGDEAMATRYGPTTLVFDAKVLKEHGGWVSLHDQLHPLDRPAMQKLEVEEAAGPGAAVTKKVFRSAQYDPGFQKVGEHAQWTYTYPHNQNPDFTRTVTFEKEVFHGADVTDALALSVVREVIHMGSEYVDLVLKMSADDLGRLVSKLFRPEAKFGSGLPITPKAVEVLAGGGEHILGVGPKPLHVHDPDGDGRYFSDGTMDPIGRWSGKHYDAADDAFRTAEHGVQDNNTVKIDEHLKDARASVEKSIALTNEWKLKNPERQELVERLLGERKKLLGKIQGLQKDWKSKVEELHGAPEAKGGASGSKEGPQKKDGPQAKGGKPKGVSAPKPPQGPGAKVSGKPKATAAPGAGEAIRPAGDSPLPAPRATEPAAPTSGPSGGHVPERAPAADGLDGQATGPKAVAPEAGSGRGARLTPGEITRLWEEDAKRAGDVFGGPQHPSYEKHVAAWEKLTQARYDVGRLENQTRVGGSSVPSAHEVKLQQQLATAKEHLVAAEQDLTRLGLDPGRVDRELSAFYGQSLKQRPRAVAGAHQPSPHPADEPRTVDDLPSAHTKAAKAAQHAKVIDPRLRTMLVQNGYATGDQFGVAAALHADPQLRVLLIRDSKDVRDRSTDIRDFYEASGVDPERVRLVDAPEGGNTKQLKQEQWRDFNKDVLRLDGLRMPSNKDIDKELIGPVGTATTTVGKHFGPEVRDSLRAGWGLDDAHFTPELRQAVGDWLRSMDVPDAAGRDVVVVWTRFSGKRGEIHVEHDTSHTGMRQILSGLHERTADRPQGPLVILAGDASAHSGRPGKFPAMATEFRALGLDVHDLTAFWKRTEGLHTWGGDTRTGQMRLFEYLHRATDGRFRHLGFRSGNLEAMALSGHQVRYLEEIGSNGGERMAKWHAVNGSTRTADNALAPGYERIVIKHPPTRSGQIVLDVKAEKLAKEAPYKGKRTPDDVKAEIKNLTDRFEHPSWVPGAGDRPYVRNVKPVEAGHTKGFDLGDVDKVVDYLAAPHSAEAVQAKAPVATAALETQTPDRDVTLVSAHTDATETVDTYVTHTSPAGSTPARGMVADDTHVNMEEGAVPIRTSEPAGPAHTALSEAFEAVRQQFPEPLARTGRWTMWGHSGDAPRTSAYAIENGALGLRGLFVPPGADGSLGVWHWHLPGETRPVAVTPLKLPTSQMSPTPARPAATPPRIAAEAAGHLASALETAPWSAGLHWRTDADELYVFGPAGPEHAAAAFADGLRPAGDAPVHVAAHVSDDGVPDSAWLTATREIGWLRERATAGGAAATGLLDHYGWRYDIAAPGGVDVGATLDLAGPHPERAEVLFPGGVDSRYIRGAQRLEGGRPVGPYLTNPGFTEPGTPSTFTEGTDR
ncbi:MULTISPECIES: hypothetical protein [unclassified Streptomyces]|uniref:scabin-related ADP-ribosyltransferase n=1 Tax=unclassified Streptomyces TaxID=2593676 RepID=UPI000DB98D0A|nr:MULTISPECIES: hypothetical protein [unclassified Streptomyces]MYT71725.1 hypothetical protein [Streptomyces sp. SID8367]